MQNAPDVQTIMGGLTDQLGSNLTTMGIAISAASGFVVFNAFGMSVARRKFRIATLRTVGMTQSQVLRLTLLESLLTGLLGVAMGLIAGPILGRLAIAGLKAVTAEGMFIFEAGAPSREVVLLGGGLGLLVSLIAALAPALGATRVAPLAARRPMAAAGIEQTPIWRGWMGLAGLTGVAIYLRLAPPAVWLRPPWDGRIALLFAAAWLGMLAFLTPSLVAWTGRWLRRPLRALAGATGMLVADHLRRERRRVMLTMMSLAISLALVISVLGFTRFSTDSLMGPKLVEAGQMGAWAVSSFNAMGGMAEYGQLESLTLKPQVVELVKSTVSGRAEVLTFGFAVIPELSFFGESYFTFVMDPAEARRGGDWLFSFNEGDWPRAERIMERGCGALVMPTIAAKSGISVGESIQISGPAGPIDCVLAGIGASFGAGSIVGTSDPGQFGGERPITLMVRPLPGADRLRIDQELTALAAATDGLVLTTMADMTEAQLALIDQVPIVLDAMAVLAVLAAGLGVVNTLTIGVVERRREFGLYRAVGATRQQLIGVVAGEAALMSAIGGALGVLGGIGITMIIPTVYGGASWGLLDMDHWAEAVRILRPASTLGLIGWAATPFIGALAGLLPARGLLRQRRLVEELLAERH
jgi:putative ABC transport system permease protein